MKVICINNKPVKGSANRYLDLLVEGKDYEVERFFRAEETTNGVDGYRLKGVRLPINQSYSAFRFIPLSDIDETELATISEQDKVYH